MQRTHRISVTKEQWDQAAAAYELGHRHAAQIARELGISPATVSREFARRVCVKAGRIAETLAEIEARLDAEAQEKARARADADAKARAAIARFVDEIFAIMDAAGGTGEPWWKNPEVTRIDKELQIALH